MSAAVEEGLTPGNAPPYRGQRVGGPLAAILRDLPLRGGQAQCPTPATSQKFRGIVRRTHNLIGDSLERLARHRPRYLLHGVVAVVGVATASTLVFQARPS